MEQTRVFEFYARLSTKQIRAFRDYIRSPFFNKRPHLISLADFLEASLKSPSKPKTKKLAFQKMYPKAPYDDQKFRLATSNLLKLLEDFVAHWSFSEDIFGKKLRTMQFLREVKLPKHYETSLKKLDTYQKNQNLRNADFFNDQVKFLQESYLGSGVASQMPYDLKDASVMLDHAYFSNKLRLTCQMLSIRAVRKVKYEVDIDERFLRSIEERGLENEPAVAVYLQVFRFLSKPDDEEAFQNFKVLINQHRDKFPSWEMRDLFLFALNFCIRRGNDGKKSYFQEGQELYKLGVETGYLLQNGELSRFTYLNAVMMSLKMEDYDWAENFIHEFVNLLNKKDRESTFSYCLAELEYARKNYNEALPLLQKVDYKNIFFHLNAKTIQLKIYYELDEYDLLHAHLDAMRIFLRRKKVLGYHRTNYENIIKYAQKLITLNPNNKIAMKNLREKIEKEEVLSTKGWFLERVDELM